MVIEGAPDYQHLRVLQGKDAEGILRVVALDPSGKVIMLPYGWDGTNFIPLLVDEEGRGITVIKGAVDVQWGLRGWWKFIASEETTVKDYSGYRNDGSVYSGVGLVALYTDGVIGQALVLDGDNDRVDIPDSNSLDMINTITMEGWVYLLDNTRGFQEVICKRAGANEANYLFRIDSGYLTYMFYNAGWIGLTDDTRQIENNVWTHIAMTYNRSWIRLYVNGVQVKSIEETTAMIPNAHKVVFGRRSDSEGEYFQGSIDELRIYDRVLSLDEIKWRYEHTNPATGKPTRMVAVDNEGSMMVNIQDLPYKDTITEHNEEVCAAGGAIIQHTSYVPAGKVWVLSVISGYITSGSSSVGSRLLLHGDVTIVLHSVPSLAQDVLIDFNRVVYVKQGERIEVIWEGLTANAVINLDIGGYVLNIP